MSLCFLIPQSPKNKPRTKNASHVQQISGEVPRGSAESTLGFGLSAERWVSNPTLLFRTPFSVSSPTPWTNKTLSSQGTGKMKLNMDGSSRGNPGPVGYGGVFRDDRGFWVLGFYGKLGDCTSLEAELWGILRGLELVQSQGMEAVEIDLDSTAAIALINKVAPEHSPLSVLIKDCKALMASTGCSLRHTYREGNKVANKLANIGVDQDHKWVSHISPPEVIIPLLEADMRGVAFERM